MSVGYFFSLISSCGEISQKIDSIFTVLAALRIGRSLAPHGPAVAGDVVSAEAASEDKK